jgi:hypothetical protein
MKKKQSGKYKPKSIKKGVNIINQKSFQSSSQTSSKNSSLSNNPFKNKLDIPKMRDSFKSVKIPNRQIIPGNNKTTKDDIISIKTVLFSMTRGIRYLKTQQKITIEEQKKITEELKKTTTSLNALKKGQDEQKKEQKKITEELKKTTSSLNALKKGQDEQKKEQKETNRILTELLQVIKSDNKDAVGIKGKNDNRDGNDGTNNANANLLDNDKNNIQKEEDNQNVKNNINNKDVNKRFINFSGSENI